MLFKKAEVANFFKFITPRREKHILKFTTKTIRITISIFFLVIYLPFVFSFIPETEFYATKVFDYILTPVKYMIDGFLSFIPGLFFIVVIVL